MGSIQTANVTDHSPYDEASATNIKGIPEWESIARAKRANRDAAIPREWRLQPNEVAENQHSVIDVPVKCGVLTAREIDITETDAVSLVQEVLNRKYSAHEVTLAFCKRAAIAQQLVNCLSETFFDKALEAAKHLDTEYAASGVPRGALHGLPVSLKDCFQVEGTDAAIGYTAFVNKPTSKGEESEITKIMRESGAILFCKTNVPLAMMAGETYNAIYGYTSNPYNRNLSSGGSSGGESALLGLRGAALGIGTDVGGSVRIPASFCGLYSLKPSAGRFPTYGIRDSLDGQEAVRNSVGPMASSLSALAMWSKAVIKSEPWMSSDPHCLPIPWREVEIPGKLCFGLLVDDGIVKPLPPVTRALVQTKAALEAQGHTIIEFRIDDPLYLESIKFALYRSAAAEALDRNLAQTQEPWPRRYEILEQMIKRHNNAKNHVHAQLANPHHDSNDSPATVYDLWNAQVKRTEYARRVLQSWAKTKARTGTGREIDALILPCSPWPACLRYGFTYDSYTSLWNVLDYCATTIPVTHVSQTEDQRPDYQARNLVEEGIWKDYSPAQMAECPVSIQLVGRRLNEEYLLGVTEVCDNALKAAGKHL